jgi:hypothetical protein
MIRFLKIQENSGLANNDVDQMQMLPGFVQHRNKAIAATRQRQNSAAIGVLR